jgi:predicted HTH transcriptional regulator
VLGILTLSKNPHDFIPCARIQFLRFQGTAWGGPIVDEHRIDGNLAKQIEQLDQKLISHNRVLVDFKSSLTEKRYYQYPLAALQQLTRNAVMHRSYEGTNSPIMVYWFDDRIEIINAGGLFGRMTPENFGRPGFADYRNPNIAEVMKVLGFVQRFGVGVQMAQTELSENKNRLPEFIHELTTTICKVWCRPEMEQEKIVPQHGNEQRLESQLESRLESPLAVKIYYLLEKAEMGKAALSKELGHKSVSGELHKQIKRMLELVVIEMTIPDKPNSRLQKYRLTEKGKKQIP